MAGSNKSTTTGGIRIDILGCSDPFSRTGRSSTYRVHVGGAIWLVDCGSPIFHLMEADEIKAIDGVIITHSHDDHRRWLTDLALYRYYICRDTPRLQLVANAALHEELEESSRNALQRSLSFDSSKMIDVPYSAFFDVKHIGPAEKFRVARIGGEWRVIDRNRTVLPASQAKVVVNPAHPRPRMLLRDDTTGAWVEPQIYYGLKSPEFYEAEHRSITGGQGTNQPFTIRIIRSTAWHGMEVIGVVFETADERVMFSSDTAFNPELFRELTDARREPSRGGMTHEEFDAAFVVEGDINDFVERGWSEARYAEAMSDYSGVVFHDTAPFRSIVHTDYRYASQIGENLVLVHTPDRFASTEVLGQQDKTLEIIGKDVYERTADGLMMLDAAVYVSAGERYYVGYKDDAGDYKVVQMDHGLIDVMPVDRPTEWPVKYRVKMFEDIRGRYYPRLQDPDEQYLQRPDGKVERQLFSPEGSVGKIVEPRKRAAAPVEFSTTDTGTSRKRRDTGMRTRT